MYIGKNQVRMHDTDMAGVLYFARQFRFAHDTLEDFVESEGLPFDLVFHKENFVFVIVHCEADYLAPLSVGDKLEIHLTIEKIGSTSFTVNYEIYKENGPLIGRASTTHVTLNRLTREKLEIPEKLRTILEKHIVS